ncbi:histidine--tRNA ligase [Spiroplasma endosymbiont of Nomada ruficornis]|uniref:histidine--tRNA ligase n=1 Tax=Spiroplasma endosymbiont of Nomada ruficornis TaxID=3066325 RepID=UPI00313B27CF
MQFQKARGTRDMYNEEVIIYRNIIKSLTQCAIKYNYQEFITPIFENAQLFLRAVGDTTDIIQKEIYQFNDKNDRLLALRPEGTAGIVRAIIENKLYKSKQTLKYFYYGSMFRYERPQKGRQRQFNQFGIETVGVKHPLVDVEVMMMALEMIKSFSIPNLTLNINYFGSNETKNKYQIALKEQLLNQSKQLCENCQIRVKVSPLRVLDCKICTKLNLEIPYLNDFLTNEEKTYFTTIINSLKNNKVNFIIDEHLVRGLDYYNGIIFEITTIDSRIGESQNTLLGGGRYDNLFHKLGSPLKIPAIGFAIGIERLMLLLVENKNINKPPIIDLQIIALSELGLIIASDLLLQLRKENYHIDMEYNLYQDKNKSQIIDRSLAKNILFLKEKNQVSFYSFVKKEMIKLIFDTEQQLFSKVKNLLLEENEEYGKTL